MPMSSDYARTGGGFGRDLGVVLISFGWFSLHRQPEPQREDSLDTIATDSGSGDSSSMGIASVMSTLLSLSMTTCSTIIWRISLRCSGVNSSSPWPTSLAQARDSLHQPPLLNPARLPSPVVVQLRPGALKPLGDELALMVELGLGDLPRHEQPDGTVLFHLDAPQVSLGLGDLLLQFAALWRIEGVDTGDDQVGVLDYPLHLAPYRLLQSLGPNVGTLSAAQAHTLHSVAHVVSVGSGKVVAVLLAVANVGGAPGASCMEVVAALAAFSEGAATGRAHSCSSWPSCSAAYSAPAPAPRSRRRSLAGPGSQSRCPSAGRRSSFRPRWRCGGTCRRPRYPRRWHYTGCGARGTEATAACRSGWGFPRRSAARQSTGTPSPHGRTCGRCGAQPRPAPPRPRACRRVTSRQVV